MANLINGANFGMPFASAYGYVPGVGEVKVTAFADTFVAAQELADYAIRTLVKQGEARKRRAVRYARKIEEDLMIEGTLHVTLPIRVADV